MKKLEYYDIRETANKWFASYLSKRNQFVSLNSYKSNLVDVEYGVPHGSILGPFLFIININGLYLAIKYSEVQHFAN